MQEEEAQERILEQIQELLDHLNQHRDGDGDGLTYQVALLPEGFDPEQATSLEDRGAIQWISEPPPEAEMIAQAIATWATPAPCPCGRMTILDCAGECN